MNVLYVNNQEFVHEVGDQTKKNNYGKITNVCGTRISNPANGAKITFKIYR
jgi:hypothetical protein